jgi:hypothetical protein
VVEGERVDEDGTDAGSGRWAFRIREINVGLSCETVFPDTGIGSAAFTIAIVLTFFFVFPPPEGKDLVLILDSAVDAAETDAPKLEPFRDLPLVVPFVLLFDPVTWDEVAGAALLPLSKFGSSSGAACRRTFVPLTF